MWTDVSKKKIAVWFDLFHVTLCVHTWGRKAWVSRDPVIYRVSGAKGGLFPFRVAFFYIVIPPPKTFFYIKNAIINIFYTILIQQD